MNRLCRLHEMMAWTISAATSGEVRKGAEVAPGAGTGVRSTAAAGFRSGAGCARRWTISDDRAVGRGPAESSSGGGRASRRGGGAPRRIRRRPRRDRPAATGPGGGASAVRAPGRPRTQPSEPSSGSSDGSAHAMPGPCAGLPGGPGPAGLRRLRPRHRGRQGGGDTSSAGQGQRPRPAWQRIAAIARLRAGQDVEERTIVPPRVLIGGEAFRTVGSIHPTIGIPRRDSFLQKSSQSARFGEVGTCRPSADGAGPARGGDAKVQTVARGGRVGRVRGPIESAPSGPATMAGVHPRSSRPREERPCFASTPGSRPASATA